MGSINGGGFEDRDIGEMIKDGYDLDNFVPKKEAIVKATGKTFQGEVPAERFGRYEDWEQYKRGGHSIIYLATDSVTGRRVAIKEHLDYMPERADEEQAIRDAQSRYEREIAILGKMDHPGIVNAQGYFFRKDHGIPRPYLVMEPLEQETLEDQLSRGETSSEQGSKRLILSVGTIADYLHTVNGRPIIYRDMKPGNIKIMGEDAQWPHKLVDFSESRIGNATMSGSVMGTFGYNAPELYGSGIADQTSDFYSLLRIAAHMMVGDKARFMKTYMEEGALREMKESGDLNISEEMLRAIERGTARDPEHRYRTLTELAGDLGYSINRVPQTRGELEAILGHKALAPRVETGKKVAKSGDYIAKILEDGSIHIGYNVPEYPDEPYCGNVFEGKTVYNIFRAINTNLLNMDSDKATLAYLQHVAPQYPILQEVLSEERSLEDVVKEEKPSSPFNGPSMGSAVLAMGDYNSEKRYEEEKEKYLARRKQLYEIFGTDKETLKYWNNGAGAGLLAGALFGGFSAFIPSLSLYTYTLFLAGISALGSIFGSNIQRYSANKELKKQAREMDSWIEEARRTQTPGSLEKKVESVDLTFEEKERITKNSDAIGISSMLLSIAGSVAATEIFDNPYIDLIPLVLTPFLGGFGYHFSEKILRNRKLKQKRLAAGLPKNPEMERFDIGIKDEKHEFIRLLKERGLKKSFWRKRLSAHGIEISYDNFKNASDNYASTTLYINAEGEEKHQRILDALKNLEKTKPEYYTDFD